MLCSWKMTWLTTMTTTTGEEHLQDYNHHTLTLRSKSSSYNVTIISNFYPGPHQRQLPPLTYHTKQYHLYVTIYHTHLQVKA